MYGVIGQHWVTAIQHVEVEQEHKLGLRQEHQNVAVGNVPVLPQGQVHVTRIAAQVRLTQVNFPQLSLSGSH